MKAVVAAFNQEKTLVGAFSVITNLQMDLFQALPGTCAAARRGETATVTTLVTMSPSAAGVHSFHQPQYIGCRGAVTRAGGWPRDLASADTMCRYLDISIVTLGLVPHYCSTATGFNR